MPSATDHPARRRTLEVVRKGKRMRDLHVTDPLEQGRRDRLTNHERAREGLPCPGADVRGPVQQSHLSEGPLESREWLGEIAVSDFSQAERQPRRADRLENGADRARGAPSHRGGMGGEGSPR